MQHTMVTIVWGGGSLCLSYDFVYEVFDENNMDDLMVSNEQEGVRVLMSGLLLVLQMRYSGSWRR